MWREGSPGALKVPPLGVLPEASPHLSPQGRLEPPGPPAQLQVQLVNGRLPVHGVNKPYCVQPPPSCWALCPAHHHYQLVTQPL